MADFLKGRKTYIIALIAGVLTAVQVLGFINAEMYATLMGFLGAGGLATLRAGIKKVE